MNYDQALAIAKDHAPELLIDPEVKGQPHINVRASKDGPPFSVMLLPDNHPDDPDAAKDALIASLDAAAKHLGVSK